MEAGDWDVISKSLSLGEAVLMVQEAPRRALPGCGGKIDIFPP